MGNDRRRAAPLCDFLTFSDVSLLLLFLFFFAFLSYLCFRSDESAIFCCDLIFKSKEIQQCLARRVTVFCTMKGSFTANEFDRLGECEQFGFD